MTLAAFASVAFVHLLAAMSPGPSFVVITRTAAAEGLGAALLLALAFGIGAVLWGAAAMLGLAVLFQVVPVLLTAMKIAGAAFLLFVAFMMWRHAPDPLPEVTQAVPRRPWATVRLGLLTQLSNPKVPVFFGAVFVGILPADITGAEIAVVLGLVLLVEGLWYVVVARLFSLSRPRAVYMRAKTGIDRVLGGALALLGARIALG